MIFTLMGMTVPMIINFTLLFNRKKKWMLSRYKWYLVLGLFLLAISFVGIIGLKSLTGKEILAFWGFTTPLLFSLIDYLLKVISKQIHNRDLYLWLRGSDDIDDSKLTGGRHVKISDRIFSMILLFSVLFLPLLILFLK